jgi:hypothetical protein
MRKSIGKENLMNKPILGVALLIFSVTLSSCVPRINAGPTTNDPMIFQTLSALPQITRDPYSLEIETVQTVVSRPKTIYQRSSIWQSGGLSWIAAKAVEGTPRIRVEQYSVASDINGNVLSKTLNVGETTYIEAEPTIYKYGAAPNVGSVFFPSRIYRYGANCSGCTSKTGTSPTSSGVLVSIEPAVQQMDGTMRPGITYEGYYVVASSPRLPVCSILEITNHRFSGSGLVPNRPFKAIVLDRGVRDNTLDLFIGDETRYNSIVSMTGKQSPKVEIIGLGTPARNANGDRICRLP